VIIVLIVILGQEKIESIPGSIQHEAAI